VTTDNMTGMYSIHRTHRRLVMRYASHDCWSCGKSWDGGLCCRRNGGVEMLWTIFMMLLILWFLGLVSSYTLGGYIHLLLVVALIVLVINVLTGRRGTA
jgi:hypothetical protein